jgi:tetratricopeptide (TPR) repeat protein
MSNICARCGNKLGAKSVFCQRCGQRVNVDPAVLQQHGTTPDPTPAGGRPRYRLTLLAVGVAILCVAAIVALGLGGLSLGLRDRAQASSNLAAQHYQVGVDHLTHGEYDLAIAEFELVLRLQADFPDAQAKLAEAKQVQQTELVPTLGATATAAPLSQNIADIDQAFARQNWATVIELGETFLAAHPDYEREHLIQMLFAAYKTTGDLAVDEDRLSDALRLYDRALALVPDDPTVTTSRQEAALYLAASSYWGADWQLTIDTFAQLVDINGNYKDAFQKLYLAHVGYADDAAANGDWCLAASQYALANQLEDNSDIQDKQVTAEINCSSTPTPTQTPQAESGTYIGGIVEQKPAGNNSIYIGGYVLDVQSKPVPSIRIMISAFNWSAIATTDSGGHYSFDGLTSPVTYTVTLLDVTVTPVEVGGTLGQFTQVNFVQAK